MAANDGRYGWWSKGAETIFGHVISKFGLHGADKPSSEARSRSNGSTNAGSYRDTRANGQGGIHLQVEVDFLTAVRGGKQRIKTTDGKTLDIDIPVGTADHAMLRLRGQGAGPRPGKEQGDLLVSVRVLDHPLFTRRGQDLYLDLPISLREALNGGKVRTPTIDGAVWLTVPAKSNSGQTLRLKDKGVIGRDGKRGDQYVRLMVTLPEEPSAAMAADLDRLAGHDNYDTRAHLNQHLIRHGERPKQRCNVPP